ncbi:serine/arginine-rich splicing factor 4-like isoform X2 [Convolutriloba macropyga]
MGRHDYDRDRYRERERDRDHYRRGGRADSLEHIQVYIGNLSSGVVEKDLAKLFKGFDVIEISVKSNNFAFVTFGNLKDVREAIRLYNNYKFMGRILAVERARGTDWSKQTGTSSSYSNNSYRSHNRDRSRSRSASQSYEMTVSNLSSKTTKSELFNLANKYGDVISCKVDSEDRTAVVGFRNETSLSRAVEKLDGYSLNDRKLSCDMRSSRSQKKRQDSSSRSRSRSRSRNGRKHEHNREKERERSRSFSSPRSSPGRRSSSSNSGK